VPFLVRLFGASGEPALAPSVPVAAKATASMPPAAGVGRRGNLFTSFAKLPSMMCVQAFIVRLMSLERVS